MGNAKSGGLVYYFLIGLFRASFDMGLVQLQRELD